LDIGTADFFGLNYYTASRLSQGTSIDMKQLTSFTLADPFAPLSALCGVVEDADPSWTRFVCFAFVNMSFTVQRPPCVRTSFLHTFAVQCSITASVWDGLVEWASDL